MDNTSVGVNGIVWSVFGSEASVALFDLRWMLVLAGILIIADLWWGTSETKKRYREAKKAHDKRGMKDHEWHVSRAGRRTLCKVVDYLTYLLMGCILGLAIFEPLGWMTHITSSMIGLSLGCICEIASIVTHVLYVKYDLEVDIKTGYKLIWRFISKFFTKLFKRKNKEVGEVIEEIINEEKNEVHHAKKSK